MNVIIFVALACVVIGGFFGLVVDHDQTGAPTTIRGRLKGLAANDVGAWTASGLFRQFMTDFLGNTNAFWTPALPHLALTTHKVALYGNSGTPNFDDTAAHNAYNGSGGAWVTANESTGAGYTAGGMAMAGTALSNVAGGITQWTASNDTWTTVTVTAYGCLIYADALTAPVADQGICAVYFGGQFTTTAGNFTIQWSANGIYQDDNS